MGNGEFMSKVFALWFQDVLPKDRKKCVDSLSILGEVDLILGARAREYAEHVAECWNISRTKRWESDARVRSDFVRCALLHENPNCWWADTDALIEEPLTVTTEWPGNPAMDAP